MKGFKNSTKTQYMKGGACEGYAKGGKVKGAAKISKVMGEFKSGELHSGSKSGPVVKNPKQAKAIALSEARKAGAKIPMKKAEGGSVDSPEAGDVLIANMTKDELAAGPRGIKSAMERMKREKIGNALDREMQIKERVKKSVPVPRNAPLVGDAVRRALGSQMTPREAAAAGRVPANPRRALGSQFTPQEAAALERATRSPSVEAPDQDPRLRMPFKKGGKAHAKHNGGAIPVPMGPAASPAAVNSPGLATRIGSRKGGMAVKKGKC